MMQTNRVGWDIGGAHVKAAVINARGGLVAVYQKPCPLWKGIEQLRSAVSSILQTLTDENYCHAITMTGELVDLFEHRNDGVKQIISIMAELLPERRCLIFAGENGLLKAAQVETGHYQSIASANWLASALFAAQKVNSGLFVDIGSTTTDILLVNEGKVRAKGYTDYQRLITQELIYTGIVRTAVMAVAQAACDEGQEVGLMAEYFATMADVYRVTGELNESHDQTETADGAEKTIIASARRLSRMIGCDFLLDELPRWRHFAEDIRGRQLKKIQQGCERQLTECGAYKPGFSGKSPLIGAGVGRFLVKEIAFNLGHPYLDFSDFFPEPENQTGITGADCAPALAVAYLTNTG